MLLPAALTVYNRLRSFINILINKRKDAQIEINHFFLATKLVNSRFLSRVDKLEDSLLTKSDNLPGVLFIGKSDFKKMIWT